MKYTLSDYRQHKDYEAILEKKNVTKSDFEQKNEGEQLDQLIKWFKEEKKRITKPKAVRVKSISELQNEIMYSLKISDSEKVKRWKELDSIKKKEGEIKEKEDKLLIEKNELKELKQKYSL